MLIRRGIQIQSMIKPLPIKMACCSYQVTQVAKGSVPHTIILFTIVAEFWPVLVMECFFKFIVSSDYYNCLEIAWLSTCIRLRFYCVREWFRCKQLPLWPYMTIHFMANKLVVYWQEIEAMLPFPTNTQNCHPRS